MRRLKSKITGTEKLIVMERQWGGQMWLENHVFNDFDVLFKNTVLEFKLADTFEDVSSSYSLYLYTKDIQNVKIV